MRALIQRVTSAHVAVDNKIVGEIDSGILVYLGIGLEDTIKQGQELVDKILAYRIFADEVGKLSLNVQQTAGGVLLVSQFTLMANTQKGLRPDFKPAMPYTDAEDLYNQITEYTMQKYSKVATGEFGANMQVSSVNDGPMNFILEKEVN